MVNRFTYRVTIVVVTVALGPWSLANSWATCAICVDVSPIEEGQPSIREDLGKRTPSKILVNLAEFLAGFD